MGIIIMFATSYAFLVAAVLVGVYRWGRWLERDAIPGLDTTD